MLSDIVSIFSDPFQSDDFSSIFHLIRLGLKFSSTRVISASQM